MTQKSLEGIQVQGGVISLEWLAEGQYVYLLLDMRPESPIDEYTGRVAFNVPNRPENLAQFANSDEFFRAVSALNLEQIVTLLDI